MYLVILKILTSILCGSLIGLERQLKGKSAGLKTNIFICLGSMLFVESISLITSNTDSIARIIAQLITGIGFLGAGCIIRSDVDRVSGLTTAAIVWVVAALGIFIGINHMLYAIGISVTITILMIVLNYIEITFLPRRDKK